MHALFTTHVDLWQEAQLCFPHRYLAMLGPCPSDPRDLNAPVRSKKQDYLEIGKILLRKFPSESTSRACRFILKLCRNAAPQAGPRLTWFEQPPVEQVLVDLTAPNVVGRIAPLMRFNAVLREWCTPSENHPWKSAETQQVAACVTLKLRLRV